MPIHKQQKVHIEFDRIIDPLKALFNNFHF